MMKGLAVLLLSVTLVGCTPIERQAYDAVVSSNASIKNLKAKHPECATNATSSVCSKLTQATAAKDTLIDAAELYCAGPTFDAGGPCTPPAKGTPAAAQATAKLQAALASWDQIAKDIKGVQ